MPSNFKGTAAEVRALNTYIKLLRCSTVVEREMSAQITTLGLTWTQFGVLEALLHIGPQIHKDLADRVLKSPGDLTTVVDNLVKRGLVTREVDLADRRRRIIGLTDAGRTLISHLFPEHARQVERAFSILDPAEQAELARLCRKLGHALALPGECLDDPMANDLPQRGYLSMRG